MLELVTRAMAWVLLSAIALILLLVTVVVGICVRIRDLIFGRESH
jgi:hypothetical protein